jgi:hypothetical protein
VIFPEGGANASFTTTAAVDFFSGDVLAITTPTPQDATLSDVAITLKGTRTD